MKVNLKNLLKAFAVLLTQSVIAEGLFMLKSFKPLSSAQVCFSSRTPLDGIGVYWISEMDKLVNPTKLCSLGGSPPSLMTKTSAFMATRAVILSEEPSELVCESEDRSEGISLSNNGEEEDLGPAIINCRTREKQEDIRVRVSALEENDIKRIIEMTTEYPATESPRKILRTEIRKMETSKEELNDEIAKLTARHEALVNALRETMTDRDRENNRLLSEKVEMENEKREIEHKIKSLNNLLESEKLTVKYLREELKRLQHQSNLEKDKLKEEMETFNRRHHEDHDHPHVRNTSVFSYVSTAVPLLLATNLILAANAQGTKNPYFHSKNRPGTGTYQLSGENDDNCKKVDYGVVCPAFEYLLLTNLFPFFNSHVHKFSVLEAFADHIIKGQSENGICKIEVNGSSQGNCNSEKKFIISSCPSLFKQIHFITSEGKVQIIQCPDKYEFSPDCNFCKKVTTKQEKLIMKSSYPLQDSFCQLPNNTEAIQEPKYKGICQIGSRKIKECDKFYVSEEVMPFITRKDEKKIYLETLNTRNLEVLSKNAFICYDYIGQHTGDSVNESDQKKMRTKHVDECKSVNSQKTNKCTGDALFCSTFTCEENSPDVFCEVAPGAGVVEVLVNGQWVKPDCIGFEKVHVRRELFSPLIEEERECSTCIFKCKESGVSIHSTGFMITSAVICSNGICESVHQKPSTHVLIKYPGLMASVGGQAGVHLSHDDASISSKMSIYCEPKDPCLVHDCIICSHGVINYQCHTFVSALTLSVLLVGIITASCFMISKFSKLALKILSASKRPSYWLMRLLMWLVRNFKVSIGNRVNTINEQIGWNDVETGQFRENRVQLRLRPQETITVIPRFSTFLIILILLPLALSCSENFISSSKMTRCETVSKKRLCHYTGTVNIRAGTIGSESCLTFKGHSDLDRKVLSIKTISSELTCREGQSFWTSLYTPRCMSSRRCHLVAECKGTTCQEWTDNRLSAEFKNAGNKSTIQENKCFEQCGGFGCDCFNVNPSCLFVHSYLTTTRKEALRVFNCVDWVHKVTFEIKAIKGDPEVVTLGNLNTHFASWGTLSLSLDAESISGTNSYSFMSSPGTGFALIDEELSQVPRLGFIGEVRCGSEAAAISAHSTCKVAPGLIKYKPMTDKVECYTTMMDPFSMFKKGSLPQTRGGKTFSPSKDRKSIQAFSGSRIEALLTLNFDDLEVEFELDNSECESSFVNITGCYSCNEGAKVCIRVKSETDGTYQAYNSDNTIMLSFHVQDGSHDYCQVIHFSQPSVSEHLEYTCGSEPKRITIQGILIGENPFDFRNKSGMTSTIINAKTSGWNFFSWLSGLTDWVGGPLKLIGNILLFVFLSIIILIGLALIIKSLKAASAGLSLMSIRKTK
ncbi:polyprotein [Ambe virus]|uniref:Envelopment polyprotein n=1 Tax=Ambe virus TaxID=1926500 RepID=A0A1S5SHT8_9VIRU|nr:polyprotein [Ambe virus]API68873.1 polyprotein [Ambe virus]